ncbi:polysaccharide biosynthesis protein [Clostridium aestuarii]|uniref:Polysaccharide biosynthesis protein n=1 Tax=Clostridium aestuarii TaxID=338193 RepID=A0ABT4D699_9CLOT|nr:polysaccharide biosynthesis protein [Clostridium aestuarii]MCY6485710.1 polysaccharide biosynthesis protein [Clostridium aestuarii]
MKKQSLVKGTFILGFAGIFSKAIGIFFRIPLAILIGDEGLGYYQMAYPLYMLFIASASGVPLAMSKMISEKNVQGDQKGVIQVLKQALFLMGILGIGTSMFMIIFAKWLIQLFRWDNSAYYSLLALGVAPVFISLMSALRGFFQGLQNMTPTAVSQILEQIGRIVIGIGLAIMFLPKGIEYAAGGATLGAAAGGILGGTYLLSKYRKIRKEFNVSNIKLEPRVMDNLLRISIPISLGAAVGTIMNVIDSIIVPQGLLDVGFTSRQAAILYGQLTGKAAVLVNVPLTISVALCASIVPIISETYTLNKKGMMNKNIISAMKISAIIALPSMCGLYFLASPILNLVFRGNVEGYLILKYSSIEIPFIILTQTTTVILQSTTSKKMPIFHLLIGCIVKIIMTNFFISIPEINVYGAVIGTISAYITVVILNMILLKIKLGITPNLYQIFIKPAYASTIMTICVVFIYTKMYDNTINQSISCLVAIVIGIIMYIILILVFKIVDYQKVKNKVIKK